MYSQEVTKAFNLSHRQFKKLFGVSKPTFSKLLDILRIADAERHKFGGRPSRIP
jgi:AraC-like DNA-binding protein